MHLSEALHFKSELLLHIDFRKIEYHCYVELTSILAYFEQITPYGLRLHTSLKINALFHRVLCELCLENNSLTMERGDSFRNVGNRILSNISFGEISATLASFL